MATEYFNDAWRIPNNKNQSLVSNYSMEFDGTNDFVNLGSSAYLNDLQQASFSSWIKFDSVDGGPGNCFLSDMNTSTLGHFGMVVRQPAGRIRLSFYLKRSLNSQVIIDVDPDFFTTEINTWYHVVMVFDGTLSGPSADDLNRAKIYINGQLEVSSSAVTAAIEYDGYDPTIGGIANLWGYWYNGLMDEVRIWDDVRTAAEISTYYNRSVASDASNLVAYYKADESPGTSTMADETANANATATIASTTTAPATATAATTKSATSVKNSFS